jgi:hypothetical protein
MATPTSASIVAFTIRQALDVLTTPDYKKYMTHMCGTLNKDLESSFKDYVEQVTNDPVHWFHVFPDQLKSEAAFRKPFSAMTKLLHDPVVGQHLNEEFCKAAAKKIGAAWKSSFKSVIEQRCTAADRRARDSVYGMDGMHADADADADAFADDGSINNTTVETETEGTTGIEAVDSDDHIDDHIDEYLDGAKQIVILGKRVRTLERNNTELKEILVSYVHRVHDDELTLKTIMKLVNRL